MGNAVFLTVLGGAQPAQVFPVAMVFLFATLISVIGGRAVPTFTRSWLQEAVPARQVCNGRVLSILAFAAMVLGGSLALTE